MSWNKNTINASHIDVVKSILDDLKINYALETKECVPGFGANDNGKQYSLRKLSCQDFVILEQILQTLDCDCNDIITSHKFTKETEPKDWKYIVKEQEEE